MVEIIDTLSKSQLQNILLALCEADPTNHERVKTYHSSMVSLELKANSGSKKRKTDDAIAICLVCQNAFDEADNHDTACKTHWGEWEADEDQYKGYDEDHFGRSPNHEDFFRSCPENFIMNCCNQPGDSVGCDVKRHRARFEVTTPAYALPVENTRTVVQSVPPVTKTTSSKVVDLTNDSEEEEEHRGEESEEDDEEGEEEGEDY
ncbi:hypothetical protein ABW20_dc0106624 [Dactylellina cionopaga]|nr:hypothetical protein ABW20_dc0106624 [Dactylellina cionopaga]